MVTQKCPRCASSRVRRGYRPTPIWSKAVFRYNLLCDNCNWEFTGFAIPGTVSTKPTKKLKKNQPAERYPAETQNEIDKIETIEANDDSATNEEKLNFDEETSAEQKAKKKRVKIKL